MTERPGRYVLPFPDRRAAGRLLAERLTETLDLDQWTERTVVLGLPRGGVAVAREVASVMRLPMNVIVTRKIGYPPQPELGVGAIAEGLRQPVYDAGLIDRLGLAPEDLAEVVVSAFTPIRERTGKMLADEAGLDRLLAHGAARARQVAGPTMAAVKDRIGFLAAT